MTYYQRKLIINLPPARRSKGKDISYYLLFTWSLFFLLNAAIIIICVHPIGIMPLILLTILALVGSNIVSNIAYILSAIAFAFLLRLYAMYLPLNTSFYISWLVILIQFCLNFKLQYKLIREIQYPTKVECSEAKITVKRKATDFWHLDTVIDFKKSLGKDKYKFGKYLTRAEKRWLAAEMNKYLQRDWDLSIISSTEPIFSHLWSAITVVFALTLILFQLSY